MDDIKGNGFEVGQTVKGFGLHNAGHCYTVKAIGRVKLQLEENLTGRIFTAAPTYYRIVADSHGDTL